MSFHSWLRFLRSALAPARGQRHHRRRGSVRAATHRLNLEVLEDRCLLSFSPATSFPVGLNPQAVVSADFNGDGRLDLATANAGGNTVSVLLGDGAGGFGTAIDSDAGSFGGNRASLAVADFNHDGHLDLATAIYYYDAPNYTNEYGRVSVLLGNGDGTFRSPTHPFGNGVPLAVAAGDFNNDGNSDLVVSEDGGDSFGDLAVLRGNGQGGFTLAAGYGFGNPDSGLAVGDLNADGKLDAIMVAGEGSLGGGNYALVGNGAFGFYAGEFGAVPDPRAVAVGDFTGDGIPDLVVGGQGVVISPGRGDGTFDGPIDQSANGNMHTGVAVADLNGDGQPDAVTSDGDTGTVSMMQGNGDGTLWFAGAFATGASPTAVVIGDFNGDGRPDVAVANAVSNTVTVLFNDGAWPDATPQLRIGDVTVTEGNTGTVEAVFTVTRSGGLDQSVTVRYATADVGATAGADYQAAAGTLTFAPGQTSKTITVLVNGDRIKEYGELFFVNLSEPTNAVLARDQGWGIILDDEPTISIADAAWITEGNAGTRSASFTVNLSVPYDVLVAMNYATADGTATAGSDYQAASGTLTFAPGETSKTIIVLVKGDRVPEPNETFFVNLSNPTNATIANGQAVGTIVDDEPRISISNVTKAEGKKGQATLFTFTVTLSAAYDQAVTMSFRTVDGTATTSDGDYVAKTGTLTFAPGETTKLITSEVKGDSKKEADETFYLDLFGNSGNSLFTKNRGIGTILNDD